MSAVQRASQILLVGQRIRQLRKSRHLTQADLASRIGITQSDLSRMESGEYKVGLDTLFRILQVFELSMSRFFEEPPPERALGTPDAPEHDGHDAHDAHDAHEGREGERQLLSDFAQLSDESQREVREFIAFKKQQAEIRRPKWPTSPAAQEPERPERPEHPENETAARTSTPRLVLHESPAPRPFVPGTAEDEGGEKS
jgi:transcriptional regulator with XRE-family HTH domain